jgi:hypothetical protein
MEHAKRELSIIGEESETVDQYLKIIEIFESGGHSGGSASIFIPTLTRLLSYQNLTPLTSDPEEWFYHGPELSGHPEGLWQNKRNPAVFSNDGGKTCYDVDSPQRVVTPSDLDREEA